METLNDDEIMAGGPLPEVAYYGGPLDGQLTWLGQSLESGSRAPKRHWLRPGGRWLPKGNKSKPHYLRDPKRDRRFSDGVRQFAYRWVHPAS